MRGRMCRPVSLCSLLATVALACPAAAGPKVASLFAANDATIRADVKRKLEELRLFDRVDELDATGGTPTLMQLRAYDAILVWSDGRSFFDRVALGNNLSQYIDGGGGVVVMNPYVIYSFGGLGGDFMNKYHLVDMSSVRSIFGLEIMRLDPMHPVLAGVSNIRASGNRCLYQTNVAMGTLRNTGQLIATWSDGSGAVIVGNPNGRPRVDLNLWPASTDAGASGCWDAKADGAKLIGNALLYVASPLRATPSSLDFGDVGVMTVSAPQTVQVKNEGSAPVVLNSGEVQPPGEFTVTLNDGRSYPITLNAGQSFTFDVRLRPAATGTRSANYVITPAMGSTPPLSLTMRGNGIGPRFAATPDSIDFGGLLFRGPGMTSSPPVSVRLRNAGGGQLRLKAVRVTDAVNFSLDLRGLMLPNILVGGAFQTVDVVFTPSMKGRFSAQLQVDYDLIGGANNQTASIRMEGSAGDPQIELPGSNITLQPVRVGKTGPIEYITVTNAGMAALRITGLMLGAPNAGDFRLETVATMMQPMVVPPNGGQGDILVRFVPTMQGLRRTTLTIQSDDPNRPAASLTIDARGTVATFAIDRMTVNFPNPQQAGTCSPPETVTVSNTGDDALLVTSIGFDGTNPASFRQPITGTRQIPGGGGRLAIPVSFCPVAIGMQTANLVIATDLMPGHTAKVPLSAVGRGPRLEVMPAGAIDFGPVYIRTTSPPRTVTLKNVGDEDIVFGKTSLNPTTAPFRLTGVPAEGSRLARDMTATFTITANPTMSVVSDATVEMVVNDQVLLGLLRIPLSVTGTQANITVLPKQMMFPVTAVGVRSPEQTLSILNSGAAPLEGLSLTLSGTHAQDFGYTGQIPMSLEPNRTVSFKVFFRPGGNGMRTGALVIRATGLAADEQVRLEGTGKSLAVSCSPDFRDFGVVRIGQSVTQQVVCQNMDSAPVDIDTSFEEFREDWSIEPTGMPIPAAMGAEPGILQLRITFAPTAEGPRNTNLLIKAKESGVVIASVGLDGNGAPMKMEMMNQGCACQLGAAASPGSGAWAAVGLLLVGMLRRRRR
ncbi:MAG: choice-of-anchor D domain-containing protein [Myxococcales bacterium]|nr:choice-of-anchor D domain-containing protein [Myxococcales bacterium]